MTSSTTPVRTFFLGPKVCHIQVADLAQASSAADAQCCSGIALGLFLVRKPKVRGNGPQPDCLGDASTHPMQLGLSRGEGNGRLSLRPLPDVGAVEEEDASGRRSPDLLAPGKARIYEDLQSLVTVSPCPPVVLVDEPRFACQVSRQTLLSFCCKFRLWTANARQRSLVEKQMSARSRLK